MPPARRSREAKRRAGGGPCQRHARGGWSCCPSPTPATPHSASIKPRCYSGRDRRCFHAWMTLPLLIHSNATCCGLVASPRPSVRRHAWLPPCNRAALIRASAADSAWVRDGISSAHATWPTQWTPEACKAPPISHPDSYFHAQRFEFLETAEGLDLGEVNDLFDRVGFPRRNVERLQTALEHTHRLIWVRSTKQTRFQRLGQCVGFARYACLPSAGVDSGREGPTSRGDAARHPWPPMQGDVRRPPRRDHMGRGRAASVAAQWAGHGHDGAAHGAPDRGGRHPTGGSLRGARGRKAVQGKCLGFTAWLAKRPVSKRAHPLRTRPRAQRLGFMADPSGAKGMAFQKRSKAGKILVEGMSSRSAP